MDTPPRQEPPPKDAALLTEGPEQASLSPRRYRRLLRYVVLSTATVAILPLVVMTAINFYQYSQAFRTEARYPVARLVSSTKRSVEFFLEEREAALRMIVHSGLVTDECTDAQLTSLLRSLRKSLSFGAFVDLGLIDQSGRQRCYAGPYALRGKRYQKQAWFHEVQTRGIYISEVFLGYRKSPHFVIAIRHEQPDGEAFILRATIDTEQLHEQLLLAGLRRTSDLFIVNREGVLQSPSRRHGSVLHEMSLPVPPPTTSVEVMTREGERGEPIFVGYSYIRGSPFILMLVVQQDEAMGSWFELRAELLGFLAFSVALILVVVVVISRKLVRSLRESDMARARVFHKMEYTNKLASLGRLAAGVAHEINNPLAIINERAGLLLDRIEMSEGFPQRDKARQNIHSIQQSVERCSAVTHRLLGFARHMDVQHEAINLPALLREVLGFLGKEATYRNIHIEWDLEEVLPKIRSDRGQLQQVFLNLINNAFAAVDDGGTVRIEVRQPSVDAVKVVIEDNGVGIPPENLERIFEPFFTTKAGVGTGLGLSVTYGIVKKLGGDIQVESTPGEGTQFTVTLPVWRGEP
jgi:signal transduction histidine kinase